MDDIIASIKADLELLKTKDGQKVLAEKFIKDKEVVTLTRQLFEEEGRDFDKEVSEFCNNLNTS